MKKKRKNELFVLFKIFLLLSLICSTFCFDFSERPKNQSVKIGERVILRCAAPPSHTKFNSQNQWRTNTNALLGFHDSGILPGYGGRYSYLKESDGELHLQIENVTLSDDGKFECQMVRPINKFLRASAFVNVLVPPTEVTFLNYPSGETVKVNEDSILNITCSAGISKPEPEMNIFVNGKKIVSSVEKWYNRYKNNTLSAYISLIWRPTKKDHNKLLSCEVNHPFTGVNLRNVINLNVLYSSDRPKIDLISPINKEAKLKAGQNITLICTTEGGNPPPRLIWSNQAGYINSSYQYDLTNQITRNVYSFIVKGDDNNAIYECSSSNRENVAPLKKSLTLYVDYPPKTVYLYGSTTVRKGESVTVSCSTGLSSPPSTISWIVNGSPTKIQPQTEKRQTRGFVTESNITIDSNILLSGQNQITIECIATNNEGPPASNQHIIRVLSPPSNPIIYEPTDQNTSALLEGEILNLTCEAQGGHPLATLSWYRSLEKKSSKHNYKSKLRWKQLKETTEINQGDTSRSTVSIKLDRSMNEQMVRCEAENGATDQALVAKKALSVLFAPEQIKIYQQEGSHPHMIAHNLNRLRCHVPSSNPAAEITWEFENTNLGLGLSNVAKSVYYTKKSSKPIGEYKGFEVENVIQFTPTEEMDKTKVRCIASHPLWTSVKATSYVLNVLYPPRVAVDGPITIVVGEGESFEESLAIRANPRALNYQWRKNNINIENTVGSIITRGSTIGGKSVNKTDSGIYTLTVSNRIGTTNVTLRLTVEYPAQVKYITSPVYADVGEDVVLECEADGVPLRQGMVKWIRGNNEINFVVRDQKRAVLRLNASYENSGVYTCIADNGIGKPNLTSAYLFVRKAPVIVRLPEFQKAAGPLGGQATLKCRAIAVPDVIFSWAIEKDKQMISYNTSKYRFYHVKLDDSTFQSSLTILNLTERDYTKRYVCKASNRLGSVQSSITVTLPSPPDTPLEIQIINVTDTSVSLGWLPGFDGGSSQTFEIRYHTLDNLEIKSLHTSFSRLTINNLKTKQTYRIQIRSINELKKSSEFSSPLQFQTLDENMQGVFRVAANNFSTVLSPSTMFGILIVFIILLTINLLLVCMCRRKHRRKKYQKKTEIARSLNQTNDVSTRPIQIYGTILNNSNGTPALSTNRRPESSETNKSEFLNEPLNSEDNESNRTIIEVNQNGYIMSKQSLNNPEFYDYNLNNQDLYSQIKKPLINHNGTYTSMPYLESPLNNTTSLMYSTINNGIEESPSLRRQTFNRISNTNINDYKNFNANSLANSNIDIGANNGVLLLMDNDTVIDVGDNCNNNYLVTGTYNLPNNSIAFVSSPNNNGRGGLVVNNAIGNYDTSRSYSNYSQNGTNRRSPRKMSTFANNCQKMNGCYTLDRNQKIQQQTLITDNFEGNVV